MPVTRLVPILALVIGAAALTIAVSMALTGGGSATFSGLAGVAAIAVALILRLWVTRK